MSSLTPPDTQNTLVDPLVAETAQKLANVINDFKRQVKQRDDIEAIATGKLEFSFAWQHFELAVVPGGDDTIAMHATLKPHNGHASTPPPPTHGPCAYKPTRRASDAELERDFVPRKKRKHDEIGNASSSEEDAHSTLPVTRADINHLLAKLRDDIQEDTSECVNHVQRQLRRLRQERHEKNECEYEQSQLLQTQGLPHSAVTANGAIAGPPFPSPSPDRDENNTSLQDTIERERKLLSYQIKWVDDCRRVGVQMHDEREVKWRKSTAEFHDRQRQDREAFQNRMLQESGAQTQTLDRVLHAVRSTGLSAQNVEGNASTPYLHPADAGPTAQPRPPAPSSAGRAGGIGYTAPSAGPR
jgi:hypothetical protein